jgi:hypothetical protein
MKPEPQSKAQERMLRELVRAERMGLYAYQVAGYGAAPRLSACRALLGRGLAASYDTGHYFATDAGKRWVRAHPEVRE